MRANDPIPESPDEDEVPEEELDEISAGSADTFLSLSAAKPVVSDARANQPEFVEVNSFSVGIK